MKKNLLILAATATIAVSCAVDKDYGGLFDGGGLDTEMTLFKGLTVPVGSFNKITIGEIASFEDSDFIKEINGDYWISVNGHSYSYDYEVPSLDISFMEEKTSADLGQVTLPPSAITGSIQLPFSIDNPIELDNTDFPKDVADIRSITMNAELSVALNVSKQTPIKALHLEEGFVIELPEWAFFDTGKKPISQGKELDATYSSAHKLTINQKITSSVTNGLTISCPIKDIKDFPAGQGIIDAGHLHLDGTLPVKGQFIFTDEDLKEGAAGTTFNAGITCDISIVTPENITAEVKLDVNPTFDNLDINIQNVPQSLLDNSSALKFKDVYFHIDTDNRFPASFDLNATIATLKNGATIHSYSLGDNPIKIAASSKQKAVISQNGSNDPGAKDYLVAGFSDILNPVPDKICLNNITGKLADSFVTVSTSDNYNIRLDYAIMAPLYLDASSNIEFDYTIDNLDFSSAEGFSFSDVELTIQVENSCPLSIAVSAELLDAAGNKASNAAISTTGAIAAGTLASPAISDVKIGIKSNGHLDFRAIKLHLTAAASGSECLNKNQGITFKNITLGVPSGITIN